MRIEKNRRDTRWPSVLDRADHSDLDEHFSDLLKRKREIFVSLVSATHSALFVRIYLFRGSWGEVWKNKINKQKSDMEVDVPTDNTNEQTPMEIDEDTSERNSKVSGSVKVMASSGTVGSVSISLHPLVIMNVSEHWTRLRAQEGSDQLGKRDFALISKRKS